MTSTIRAVDVSSHNPPSRADLDNWIGQGCQLLIIHCYSSAERAGLGETTRQWAAHARDAGVWHLPYLWLFGTVDPIEQVRSALDLWRDCGETPGLLFLDCEAYGDPVSDEGPNVDQIMAAAAECRRQGVTVALYSASWWLLGHLKGDTAQLHGMAYWGAQYDAATDLDSLTAPYQLDRLGKQYQGSPLDWSVFDLVKLTDLAKGCATVDPCQSLKEAVAFELSIIRASMDRIAAILAA